MSIALPDSTSNFRALIHYRLACPNPEALPPFDFRRPLDNGARSWARGGV